MTNQSDKNSSFSKSLSQKEMNVLKDLTLTRDDIKSVLITNGYVNVELISFIEILKWNMSKFNYSSDDFSYLIKSLGELTGHKIYLQSQQVQKNTFKTYLENIEANTWLSSKSENNEDKVKTDTFVKNETIRRMNNIALIHSYIIDLHREIDTYISSIDSLVSFINVKIKYLRDERNMLKYSEITIKK